ncbi:hypothetical protein ACRU6B_000920 [Yersinia enterocolitica]|nr:hypothetical protein [Yersinia enterocolitica]
MPKSTIYLINSLLVILLMVALVWIGNTVVSWLQSKSYHGYEIYNCPKDISKSLEWFEAKKFCQTVERVDSKFFEVDEDDVKERAKRQNSCHIKIFWVKSLANKTLTTAFGNLCNGMVLQVFLSIER